MRMAWGDEWTGSEWVRAFCTELRLWLGILLLPPGLANHRFCMGHGRERKQWVGEAKAQTGVVELAGVPSPLSWAHLRPANIWTHTHHRHHHSNPQKCQALCFQLAHLSALAPKAGAGEGACRGDAPNARRAQRAHPARRKGPGRHWELPLGPRISPPSPQNQLWE